MLTARTLLLVWLIAGAALLGHDAATGGGLAGWLLLWQFDAFEAVAPALTYAALAILLVAVPGVLLLRQRAQAGALAARRSQWTVSVALAASLGVFSVMALQQAGKVPNDNAPLVRFTIFGSAATAPLLPDDRVILQGVPQTDHAIAYDELTLGKLGHALNEPHRFVPMTGADWTATTPVHFLADIRGAEQLPGAALPGTSLRATAPGVLLQDAVPAWLRDAFAARGVVVADDARVHSADLRGERTGWFMASMATGLAAVLCLLAGVAMRRRNIAAG